MIIHLENIPHEMGMQIFWLVQREEKGDQDSGQIINGREKVTQVALLYPLC